MSLRRFMVLVRGLGPHSATTVSLQARRWFGETTPRETTSPQQSENALASFFGGKPAQVH